MTDIPVLMTAPMVLGLLQGRKTMTRRLAWHAPYHTAITTANEEYAARHGWQYRAVESEHVAVVAKPTKWQSVQPGDLIWVRETHWRYGRWKSSKHGGKVHYSFDPLSSEIIFAADQEKQNVPAERGRFGQREPAWHQRPAIFLERKLSRITLEVDAPARVEKLWTISERDCEREGIEYETADPPFWYVPGIYPHSLTAVGVEERSDLMPHRVQCFRKLWIFIHGRDAWERDPDVIPVSFKVHVKNIDAFKKAHV